MPRLQVRVPGHDREKSLGHIQAAWIEQHCRHGIGDINGQQIRLDDGFYNFIVDCYALDANGGRLYRVCVLSLAKGNAKSELAGWLVLADSFGPSRFSSWAQGGEVFDCADNGCACGWTYTYQLGEPMGEAILDPIVKILATEEKQSNNTYRNVYSNLTNRNAPLAHIPGIKTGTTRTILPGGGGGEIRRATSSSNSADGGLETMAVIDESHLWTGLLKELYDIVDQNLPKRGGWMLVTTTMFRDGDGSIAEDHYKTAIAISSGEIENSDQFLLEHVEGSPISDLDDVDALMESLLEAYQGRKWINYKDRIAKATNPRYDKAKYRRYYLNQQSASAEAYLTDQEIKAVSGTDETPVPPLRKGDTITLGLDYAKGNITQRTGQRQLRIPDATVLIACRVSDMSIHRINIWEADERAAMAGWNPPLLEIEQTVDETFRDYTVVGMFADPTGIETYIDKWTAKYLKHLKVRASTGRPMYRYMSGASATQSGKDIEAFYEAVAEEQLLIAPDAQMIRHFLNARRSWGKYGLALYKATPDSAEKIDAVIGAVMAHAAAVVARNRGITGESGVRRSVVPRRIR